MGVRWAWLPVALCGAWGLGCHEDAVRRLPGPPNPDTRVETKQPRPPTPPPTAHARQPGPNVVVAENLKPGAPDWRAGRVAWMDEIELYTSVESVSVAQEVGVKVSSNAPATITAEVFRIGWYDGAGARRVWKAGPWTVDSLPPCPRDPVTSRVECDWPDTFRFTVGADWPSGFYIVKIVREDGLRRWAPFVVRDNRAAEILFTPNFSTWQAYNDFGGESLYQDASGTMPSGRAWEVSFNRPYREEEGGGKTFELDIALIQLLEQYGYDVTYGSQLDFLRFDHFLDGIGAFVHGGQDEYWPEQERDQIDAALASGQMSLAYFGGNGGYWRMRTEPDRAGTPHRTIACYKSEPQSDPVPYSTIRYRDEPNARPESALFGVMYENWQLVPFPLVVTNPSHWMFQESGLQFGESLPGLVGFEYDRAFPELSSHPSGIEVAMQSPVVSAEGIPSFSTAVTRFLPSGTLVFSAGTIWWPRAIGRDPRYHDARLVRVTLNVLERALAHRRAPRVLPPVGTDRPIPATPQADWVASVAPFAGVAGDAGHADGPAASARFSGPTGLDVSPDGTLIVADTGGNRIRLVRNTPQGWNVQTIAGNGRLGYRDGQGPEVMFRRPTDVAVGPGGEIYVADSDNHAIRRIDPDPSRGWTVRTVAGAGFVHGYTDGPSKTARFNRPTSIDVDAAGNLYVADQANHRVRMIRADTSEVVTVAGTGEAWGWRDAALGTQAQITTPSAIAVGGGGEVYVLDATNQLVRRIDPDPGRSVTTVAGQLFGSFGYRDGAGNQAQFLSQMGLEVTSRGDVLLADTANFRIRKVVPGADAASTRVHTIAGSGQIGSDLGTGDVADIVSPTGIAVGPNRKIYVSDSFHNVIREITP